LELFHVILGALSSPDHDKAGIGMAFFWSSG
jgi:hypothetical protein